MRGARRTAGRPAARRPARWGALPVRSGIILVVGATAFGMIITIVAGGQPGFVLGFFLVAGTAAAALAVRPRAVYRIIPVPPLAYVAASLVTVPLSGSGASSRTALALGVVQALASGFLAIIVATVIAIAVTVVRGRHGGPPRRGPGPRPSGGEAGTLLSNTPRPDGPSGRTSPRRPSSPRRPGF